MPNKAKYMGPTPYMQTDMENQNAAIMASPASRKISANIAKMSKPKAAKIKAKKAYQE